jgi:hypothetical protein
MRSQPGQKSETYLAFQLVRVDGRCIDFWTIGTCEPEWWHVLGLHCDDLAATDRSTMLGGESMSHGGSSEKLKDAFSLTLYTASENWKQQVRLLPCQSVV